LRYKEAGVDIEKEKKFIDILVSHVKFRRNDIIAKPIHYTSLIDFGDYYLTLNTDGVGSKVLIAEKMNMWEGIAIDCVAMNVNDAICVGSEPIAFVDYIALREEKDYIAEQLGIGFNKAMEMANISLVGGETATLPELINGIDVSGTCLGRVRKSEVITGEDIKRGDIILYLQSSGIHSNGLTLARKIFEMAGINYQDFVPELGRRLGEELLEPTRIYVREVISMINTAKEYGNPKEMIRGIAHITGGGFRNINRLKPMRFIIDKIPEKQKIFSLIQELGNVSDEEMYQTFNMGAGMILIISENFVNEAKKITGGRECGYVDDGEGVFIEELGIEYLSY